MGTEKVFYLGRRAARRWARGELATKPLNPHAPLTFRSIEWQEGFDSYSPTADKEFGRTTQRASDKKPIS